MRTLVMLSFLAACEQASAPRPQTSPPPCAKVPPDARPTIDALERGPAGKRRELERLLDRGPVKVYIDARRPGVVVPPAFASEKMLTLQIGRSLEPPVPDLVLDERGFSGTLTFSGTPFHVVVPWSAAYAYRLEEPLDEYWIEDAPEGVEQVR